MNIYALKRKNEILALIFKGFSIAPYYLMSSNISPIELEMIQEVAKDLCIKNIDFTEYNKYWINDYRLEIHKEI